MNTIRTAILLLIFILFGSCDEYCDFEFSEEYFPLEIGNEWLYHESGIWYQRWEITDVINRGGKNIYILSIFYKGNEEINLGYLYFDDKKLITTLFTTDNDSEEFEYVLADFSLDEGDTLKTGIEDAIVIVGKKEDNKIAFFKFHSGGTRDRYYPFNAITFQLGKGIVEYWDWAGNNKLIDYNLN